MPTAAKKKAEPHPVEELDAMIAEDEAGPWWEREPQPDWNIHRRLLWVQANTPRLAKFNPNTASVLASRTSHPSVMVTPTPNATPLIAAMTGLGNSMSSSGKVRTKASSPSFGPAPISSPAMCAFR